MALPALGFAVIFQAQEGMDGRLLPGNYVTYGILSALLAGVTAVFCVWGTRTVIPRLPGGGTVQRSFSLPGTLADFRIAFTNRKFLLSTGAGLVFGIATGVYSTLSLYLGTYFWEFSSAQLAGLVVPTALATLLAFTVLARIGQRVDKPGMLTIACLVLALDFLFMLGARLLGLLPPNGHPFVYVWVLACTGVGVFAVVTLHVVTTSLTADLLDEQELATGLRQEGVFFAAGAFVLKATTGLGALLAGTVVDIVGIVPGSGPGSFEPAVVQQLGWFAILLTSGMALIAGGFYRRICMTRDDLATIRRRLAQRAAA